MKAEDRLAAAERRAAKAEDRLAAAERRAAEAEERAAAAEHRAAEADRRLLAATDRRALEQVVSAAEDVAAALRRLAARPAPVPPPARQSPPKRRTPARRAGVVVPPGMRQQDPAAEAAMVRTPGVAIIVDGYNVSMLAWPDSTAADQRDRLCAALAEFQLRIRRDITVVFDGADVRGVRPLRRKELRVVFSPAGQEADVVIVDEVIFRPEDVPVIVVTSDREVRTAAELEGAAVLSADAFLRLIGR